MAPKEPLPEEERVYDDAKRKREILPPRETWPGVVRPALQGKVKILEDRPLTGQTVLLGRMPTADIKGSKKEGRPSPQSNAPEGGKGGAQQLLEQITPLLN